MPTTTVCPNTAGDDQIAGWTPGAVQSHRARPVARSNASTCPVRVAATTVLLATAADPAKLPRPMWDHSGAPDLMSQAAITPRSESAITRLPDTTGEPSMAPSSGRVQASFRCAAGSAVRAEPAG